MSIIPNWFASAMQAMGPKQQVVKPPPPSFTPRMALATAGLKPRPPPKVDRSKLTIPNPKKRPSSGGSPATKRKRKEVSLPMFGESFKRKAGSMESLTSKKARRPSISLPMFGESKKRSAGAAFNPPKKMKPMLSSQKRRGSLGSLENLFKRSKI